MGVKGSRRQADYRRYRELVETRPGLFDRSEGGIAILLDEGDIAAASKLVARRNRAKGLPASSASIGVLVEDAYILVLRDAVRFPDGSLGTHNRVIYANGARGVGVLPLLDGRIVLLRVFRHAIGRFLLEIPRGSVEAGDELEETVLREIAEETGGHVTTASHLGRSFCDTSLSNAGLDYFLAQLSCVGEPQLSEGIFDIVMVTPERFAEMVMTGEMEDTHAVNAFCMARLRGLVP
ncbi:ADP-ribose pyrophosphatase [Paramagnetospirillum magnetotacticum MS-1]|uniref:GDP-mannose pyrophosphatase n=1 Tax=Paramagnetospirillum magnetotacticum MS-1 TaxID=272627 RepID=A0A0C2YZW9_PARME|nr:NUDIX hydrolase [Paramagnetospirillum magnetotacticum]KIM00191.1 ADP-ribose pyrophosphatase [Paramagnetospirillum magnetotacticum MS-1]